MSSKKNDKKVKGGSTRSQKKPVQQKSEANKYGGIPDEDLKKFLGCG